nr:MAG TPA: antigen S-antigen protein [Caudoviricetes sp.]
MKGGPYSINSLFYLFLLNLCGNNSLPQPTQSP